MSSRDLSVLKKVISKLNGLTLETAIEVIDRAIAAEAKLAEIDKQEPVAHRWIESIHVGEQTYIYEDGMPFIGNEINDPYKYERLYASPVQQSPAVAVPDFESWWNSQASYRAEHKYPSKVAFEACIGLMLSTPTPPSAELEKRKWTRDEAKKYNHEFGRLMSLKYPEWRNDDDDEVLAEKWQNMWLGYCLDKTQVEQPDSAGDIHVGGELNPEFKNLGDDYSDFDRVESKYL